MKTNKKFARIALATGLTATMAFGTIVTPASMAFAAGAGSTVTFEDGVYSASSTYKGIQIFKGTVAISDEATTVSSIDWASDTAKAAVLTAIKAKDASYASENAQDAADWLNANAGVSGVDSKVESSNVLSMIAANLNDSGAWKTTTAGNASLSGLEAGYWLFLTDTAGTPDGTSTDAFTSPVYAVIDGTSSTIVTPKKGVPTVEKKILDDADATVADVKSSDKWRDVADSQIGQEVNYKLTGTIASNYATFDAYAYKFTDVLSSGLDYVDGSVEVYALNSGTYTEIDMSKYEVAWTDNALTVEFKVGDGHKGLKDVEGVNANTEIVVFYKAKLNGNATIGNADGDSKGGNPNTVKLAYSNNPYAEGMGETIEDAVADFAFKLNLNKVDQGTEKGLAGAVFTIQSADSNTEGQYIASMADANAGVVAGQLVTVADAGNLPDYVKFASGNDGVIAVSGLDAGSYTVTEVKTPDDSKYTKADPFTFTIAAQYDDTAMKVTSLKAEISEADKGRTDIAFGTLDGTAGDNKLTATDGTGTNAAAGEVTINVGNTKSVGLPITGLGGVTLTWVIGAAVLIIGVAHLIRSRRAESEE
ncbi:isopeptide-forming domain-containing fimbrial protein [uncultured Slackia sp.]|uniref:isopeptide-forming domain-containing fimbrial protein n=1 Tax=uncultured Slackia sp. TaxID=665903 RepID=UPI0025DD4AAB|nr:isopeptide-forming domain-containing fimbrial protein [uncultured Slackia sp.]